MNSLKEASIISIVETEASHEIISLRVIDSHKTSKLQLMGLANEFSKLNH